MNPISCDPDYLARLITCTILLFLQIINHTLLIILFLQQFFYQLLFITRSNLTWILFEFRFIIHYAHEKRHL